MLSAKVDEPMKRLLDECIETVYIIKGTTDTVTVTHVLELLARVGMTSLSRSGHVMIIYYQEFATKTQNAMQDP